MKIGTIDLEILDLAVKKDGTFNESDLENSNLKRLGVGRILDALASLKDRRLIQLNQDGSFTITDLAKECLWSDAIPLGTRVLRLLQIKSCSTKEIRDILGEANEKIIQELEEQRKNQFILMSPQRINETITKVFEILPEGIQAIEDAQKSDKANPKDIIKNIRDQINSTGINQTEKDLINEKLNKLQDTL